MFCDAVQYFVFFLLLLLVLVLLDGQKLNMSSVDTLTQTSIPKSAEIKTSALVTIDPIAAGMNPVDDPFIKRLPVWDVGFGTQSLQSNASQVAKSFCTDVCSPDCKWHKIF